LTPSGYTATIYSNRRVYAKHYKSTGFYEWQKPACDDSFGFSLSFSRGLDAAKLPDDFMNDADRDRRPAEERPAIKQLFEDDAPEGSEQQ
jgi:hypothetical protein